MSEDLDEEAIDNIYVNQGELLEGVSEALEGALEFIEKEEIKMEIMKKSQELEQ